MTTWLQKQKKQDLVDLAKKANLPEVDDMLKDELVDGLNTHLRANETTLSSDPSFAAFYQRTGSPVKKEKSAATGADGEKPPRKRKQSLKVKEELDSLDATPDKTKALATRTPKAVQRVASRVPLPPSPADVTDAIDRQTAIIRRRVSNAWDKSGVDDTVDKVRDYLGSVEGISLVTLILEALFLRNVTMPWVPGYQVPQTNFTPAYTFYYPNIASIFDVSSFWAPSLLWLTTSLFAPGLISYFVNLTKPKSGIVSTRRSSKGQYPFDPLVFNVAKALLSWMVYTQGFLFWGLFSEKAIWKVKAAIPAEGYGLIISAGIGGVAALYDAVLKK